MPQVDVRPASLDALSRPGNAVTFTLTFPAGYLTGKTWSCSVGGSAVVPTIVGDVMTIVVSSAATTTLGNGRHAILLTETTSGATQVRISGRLLLGTTSTDATDQTVTVNVDTVSVTITVASGSPGVPAGGTVGQALVKNSSTDGDASWTNIGTQVELDAEAAARAAADAAEVIARNAAIAAQAATDAATYQPLDSDLTAIAALSTTAFGRSVLELANAGAGRTLLGLGTAATAATGDFDAAGAAAAAQAASQPLDSDLTALAALTTTAYGRSLLEAANAAALRTLAGLVLGTDIYSKAAIDAGFQPLDADLTAIAALVSAADKVPYATGAGAWALATQTAFARTLLDDADAATARATLGIKDLSIQTASVATSETRANTAYGDLATSGPAVTFMVPSAGWIRIDISANIADNTASQFALVSWALSGANTQAAADTTGVLAYAGAANGGIEATRTIWIDAATLTPGSTTITLKYRSTSTSTATFKTRSVTVTVFPA